MSIGSTIGGLVAANGGPVAIVLVGAQIIGRAIPDNKKGFLGFIRKAAKLIGLYATPDLNAVQKQAVKNAEAAGTGIDPAIRGAVNR